MKSLRHMAVEQASCVADLLVCRSGLVAAAVSAAVNASLCVPVAKAVWRWPDTVSRQVEDHWAEGNGKAGR